MVGSWPFGMAPNLGEMMQFLLVWLVSEASSQWLLMLVPFKRWYLGGIF